MQACQSCGLSKCSSNDKMHVHQKMPVTFLHSSAAVVRAPDHYNCLNFSLSLPLFVDQTLCLLLSMNKANPN